jgi:hypothetical protein
MVYAPSVGQGFGFQSPQMADAATMMYMSPGGKAATSVNQSAQQSTQQSQQQSNSYIPDYSQTPILEQIAKYSASMAPQVYQWGMDQFNKNQGNIDALMRNALSYASPQRIATDVGQAEAGVQQGAEAGRQAAIQDLQSYGIDPSAGRYAGLDQANRVMTGASAAGAGNQQRMADIAQGNAMQNQAISSSLQNVGQGVATTNAANDFAKTGMSLPYSPLGTVSSGSSTGQSTGESSGFSNSAAGANAPAATNNRYVGSGYGFTMARGGPVEFQPGGDVPPELSPSRGAQTDDVNASLNAGEFVIPKDVASWQGQKFFYELMAKSRKDRAMAGSNSAPSVGYGAA